MGLVRCKDTKPELVVRRLVYSLGFRYRLHVRGLPGKPDLVFKKLKKVIFVNGCFWHRHEGCPCSRIPKSRERRAFWENKLNGNVERDRNNLKQLRGMGWDILVVWECEVGRREELTRAIVDFLNPDSGLQRTVSVSQAPLARFDLE